MTEGGQYLDKAALKAALTGLHEKRVDEPLIGGGVLLRELSARGRLLANEAATSEDEEAPDNALYRAMLLQSCIVDPASGTAYADGRVDVETGAPLIDPRTRAPMFSADEIAELMEGRDLAVARLITEIVSLSALLPTHLKSIHREDDSSEYVEGPSAETGISDAEGPEGG